MPDIFEAITNLYKSLADDEPKPPLHIVEASNCWLYLAFLEEAIGLSQVAVNTTSDEELSSALHEELHLLQTQMTELRRFLVDEGVELPPASQQKPKCESSEIPAGVKKSDYEIANELSFKIATATMSCAKGATESIRNDVGLMFARFLGQKLVYGASLKTLMRKRGWIKTPPSYTPSGTPK